MAYRPTDPKSRWKAMLAALAVTSGMGAVIITGLNVEMVGKAIERLETFDISIPPVPPPPPPPPPPEQRAPDVQGAPAAPEASPVVAPEPVVRIPTEQPIAAAPEPGAGAGALAGQGGAGTGTGAGGTGTGAGAGAGAGAGGRPARLVRNLTNADYRRLTGDRIRSGSAALALRVDSTGNVDSCQVVRSSGDASVDSGICALVSQRLRFDPARDAQGRPVPYSVNYRATWDRR
jgi:periplasmic protein TonB